MTTIRGDLVSCPYCSYQTDAVTEVYGEATPAADDWSICMRCGRVARFTGDEHQTRALSDAEESEALDDPQVVKARGAVLALIATRGGR